MTLEQARQSALIIQRTRARASRLLEMAAKREKALRSKCPHEWSKWMSNGYENGKWRECLVCGGEE